MKKKCSAPQRIIVDAVLLMSLFMLPWWLFVIFALYALFKYDQYYEFIFFGIVFDSVYSVSDIFIFSNLIFSASSVVIYVMSAWFKERVISYR